MANCCTLEWRVQADCCENNIATSNPHCTVVQEMSKIVILPQLFIYVILTHCRNPQQVLSLPSTMSALKPPWKAYSNRKRGLPLFKKMTLGNLLRLRLPATMSPRLAHKDGSRQRNPPPQQQCPAVRQARPPLSREPPQMRLLTTSVCGYHPSSCQDLRRQSRLM